MIPLHGANLEESTGTEIYCPAVDAPFI